MSRSLYVQHGQEEIIPQDADVAIVLAAASPAPSEGMVHEMPGTIGLKPLGLPPDVIDEYFAQR